MKLETAHFESRKCVSGWFKVPLCVAINGLCGQNRSGSNIDLFWLAQRSLVYRVQFKTNLADSAWYDLSGDVTAAANTATKTDTTLGNAQQRFYRIELLR